MTRPALLLVLLPLASLPLAPRQAPAQTPAAIRADTVPSLRWRLFARGLLREQQAQRRTAEAARDSATLRRLPSADALGRMNAVIGGAQYQAAEAARADAARPSARMATAAAAATVLAEMFPDAAPRIAQELARDSVAEVRAGIAARRVAAGARLGRSRARAVARWALADGRDRPWTGTVPTGAGMWRSAPGVNPIGPMQGQQRPWILASGAQFRPGPPPAYGSPEFESALDEVRRVARERTPEQTRIARRWASQGGANAWLEVATDLLLRHRVPEDRASRLLSLMAVGGVDLGIACWEAKYHYWTLRPTHADSTITLADSVGLPNFPAYPSGHACGAGFSSTLMSHYIPEARDEITRLAEENAVSRLYAGVHYRFDNDVGLELGRSVARYVLEQDARGALRGRWQ